MDTSQNKDIARRQSLLGVAGVNAIPPQHIVNQQRQLSQTEFESQTRKIIPLEHRELCPLCHCPSFIFLQTKYIPKSINNNNINNINQLTPSIPGTFMCKICINNRIKNKLLQINTLKKQIKQLSNTIKPILIKKLNNKNSKYYDNKLKSKQYQQTISNLRTLIKQKQNDNKLLKNKCQQLQIENDKRKHTLNIIEPKLHRKWDNILNEYKNKYKTNKTQEIMNSNICKQISLNKLLQITDFYKMKVLPTINSQTQLSMISNIAIPSIFKIKHIKLFYNNSQNELFGFPLPNKQSLTVNIPNDNNQINQYPYYNKSSSSLINYKSTKYEISLKNSNKYSSPASPLQKYIPRITKSITSVSNYINRQQRNNKNKNKNILKPKSLPDNLDDLILPPTFFNDNNNNNNNNNKQLKDGIHKRNINKIIGRDRSQSLDALSISNDMNKIQENKKKKKKNKNKKPLHEPHIEHGICAALQYIVSYILNVSKYLNIELLYPMGLYKKNKKGKFIIHTYICRKGKYFRLYWINTVSNEEFEVGLHLLQENINNLCIKCGVKSSKLKYLQFIDNLNILINHLKIQKGNNNRKINNKNNDKKLIIKKPKIEPLNIINNYGSPKQSTSHSVSHSFSESTTTINNSESDHLVISPTTINDSEHEDWDFVDYT